MILGLEYQNVEVNRWLCRKLCWIPLKRSGRPKATSRPAWPSMVPRAPAGGVAATIQGAGSDCT